MKEPESSPEVVKRTFASIKEQVKKYQKELNLAAEKAAVEAAIIANERARARGIPRRFQQKVIEQKPVSDPLLFITILHLANENKLKLESKDDCRDFKLLKD